MNRLFQYRRSILLAVVAVAAAFQLGNSRVEASESHSQNVFATTAFFHTGVLGVVGGQKIRYCVGTTSRSGPALDWNVSLSDERGTAVFQTPEIHSPSGEWRCVDIPRSAIPLPGDPPTGRVQVAARNIVRAPVGTKSTDFIGSYEIINPDGTTAGAVAGVLYAAFHNNDLED